MINAVANASLWAYADLAYQGADPAIIVPFRRRPRRLSRNQRTVNRNRNRARNRAPGERAVATLKTWRILTKLRCCPQRATATIAAIRVLQKLHGSMSASKIGSSTIFTAACTIRSRTDGIDNGLNSLLPGLGMNTRRAGGGR